MRLFLISILFCVSQLSAQDSLDNCTRQPFVNTGGLVAYYFWEEDSMGMIVPGTFEKPCVQNVYVIGNPKKKKPKFAPSSKEMNRLVTTFAASYKNTSVAYTVRNGEKQKKHYPLVRYAAKQQGSLSFILSNNSWKFQVRKSVLYFSVWSNGSMSYSHSADSIALVRNSYNQPANGQYVIYSFYKKDGTISSQSVLNYQGLDVTELLFNNCKSEAKRCLIFVNGYRGPLKEKDKSANLVSMKDRFGYWYKLDDRFINRLKPDGAFYLDANFSVKTSVHQRRLKFLGTFIRWALSGNPKAVKHQVEKREEVINADGFVYRKEKGRIAGLAFLYAKCTSPDCDTIKDTVDIVCHSMGYAYTLGFLESIEGKVVLGSCYIIAPENAAIDGYDWSKFQHVWQYGCNFDQKNPDALKYQDGVAPQFGTKGLDALPPKQGGRIFFPDDWPNKQFIHSHMVYSYDWIFDRIEKGMPGYVGRVISQ